MDTIDNKILWTIIDTLRDDINAHIDGITDLNKCVDKLQKEKDNLLDEWRTLKDENYSLKYDATLHKEHEELKKLYNELREENKQLKEDKLIGSKVSEDYEDELIKENKKLKQLVNNSVTNRELSSEALEYFEHNPKSEYVGFFMLDNEDIKRGENGELYLYEDDAFNIHFNYRTCEHS